MPTKGRVAGSFWILMGLAALGLCALERSYAPGVLVVAAAALAQIGFALAAVARGDRTSALSIATSAAALASVAQLAMAFVAEASDGFRVRLTVVAMLSLLVALYEAFSWRTVGAPERP